MNVALVHYPRSLAKKMATEARYFAEIGPQTYSDAALKIHEHLVRLGINFEGKRLPVSLRPTLLTVDEVNSTSIDLGTIRVCLNKLLTKLVNDLKDKKDSALTNLFSFYRPWFDLIAQEVRSSEHIMLMRYDAAVAADGLHKVMEPNGACPGGVIHCAYIREGWLQSDLARSMLAASDIREYASDSPDGFLNLLFDVAPQSTTPTIALCNYKGVFSNELGSLKARNEYLKTKGIARGDVIVCDIRDIQVKERVAYVAGMRIDVVYNKIDHMMVHPEDPDIRGWIAASQTEHCEFLNSLAALYIAEAKSAFAALWDRSIQEELDLSRDEITAITRRIPRTRMLLGHPDSPSYSELVRNRTSYVAKADALTRGAGVYVGRLEDENTWGSALLQLARANAVIQDVIDIPTREAVHFEQQEQTFHAETRREYYGIDYFLYGADFGGVVSRCHSSMIFNVGSGGQEVPTFVLG